MGLTLRPQPYLTTAAAAGGGGGGEVSAPFAQVNGPGDDPFTAAIANSFEGWSVNYASQPTISALVPFTVRRQSFDAAGAATTFDDTFYVTKAIRQPAPNNASQSALSASISSYIYDTDTIFGGALNKSTVVSPKPTCNTVTLCRRVLDTNLGGTADPYEITVWHRNGRNGRQCATVIFKITDGSTTISVTVSAMSISPRSTDKTSVIVVALPATDISSLSDGLITVNHEVYPWVGATASVAKSATDGLSIRGHSPRYFRKKAGFSPPYAVIALAADAGDGIGVPSAGGVISTTLAVAKATPFATWKQAMDALQTAAAGLALASVDGAICYFANGTHDLATPTNNMTQNIAAVRLRRLPTSTNRASVLIRSGTAAVSPKLGTSGSTLTSPITEGCISIEDITYQRNGAQPIFSGAAGQNLQIQFDDIDYDFNAQNSAILSNSHLYINGCTTIGVGIRNWGGATTGEMRLIRGVDVDFNALGTMEAWLCVGNIIRKPATSGLQTPTTRNASGFIFKYNKIKSQRGANLWQFQGGNIVGGIIMQNEYEYDIATAGHSLGLNNDSATYSAENVGNCLNTYIGYFNCGRENLRYDEGNTATSTPTPGTAVARSSKLAAEFGNIHVAVFSKGDRFHYENEQHDGFDALNPSTRLGNWNYMHGVDCFGNFAQFTSNGRVNVNNEAQEYPGLWTTMGEPNAAGVTWNNAAVTATGQTIRNDPKFVSYAGTTWSGVGTNATAGAGGGDYRLQSTSPAKGMLAYSILPYTLDGVARPLTSDHAGAFSAQ